MVARPESLNSVPISFFCGDSSSTSMGDRICRRSTRSPTAIWSCAAAARSKNPHSWRTRLSMRPALAPACKFCSSVLGRSKPAGSVSDRLLPAIEESPLIRRELLGKSRRKPPVMNIAFENGSRIYLRAAFNSADACRGLSADLLLVDEFQDIAAGHLPVLARDLESCRRRTHDSGRHTQVR